MILFTSITINLGFLKYLQIKKLEVLEHIFKNTQWAPKCRSRFGEGFLGKLLRLNNIALAIIFQKTLIRRGEFGNDTIALIPKSLKNQVRCAYFHLQVNGIGIGAIYIKIC